MFSSLIIFKGLLKNLPYEEQAALLNFLSDKTKEQFELTSNIFVPLDFDKFTFNDLLSSIHYSWLVPFLEANDKEFFLPLLEKPIASKLKSHFNTMEEHRPPVFALQYFKKCLFDYLLEDKKDLLPKEYLPDSELNILLDFSKNELILLMDYLSLYDLAIQMHKIVDPKILKKINLYLDDNKKQFLKTKSSYKENFSFPPLALEDKDESDFLFTLHKRGLNRFAKALSDQDGNLIWYLSHTLDVGRGKTLMKFSKEKTPREIISSITSNIIELLPIIKTKAKKD